MIPPKDILGHSKGHIPTSIPGIRVRTRQMRAACWLYGGPIPVNCVPFFVHCRYVPPRIDRERGNGN